MRRRAISIPCVHHLATFVEQVAATIRSLTREGVYPSSTSSYTEYRWISRERFGTIPFYLCGDKLGIVIFQSDPPPKIILIRSSVVADAYRQQFEEMWDAAKIIPIISEGQNND